MAQRGPPIQLKLKLDKREMREKGADFFGWFMRERDRGEKGNRIVKLPSKIYGVLWLSFRQAKNKSSLHQQEVRVGT